MSVRHIRTHAVGGLLVGLSVVSSSLLGMFLANNPGGPLQATNACATGGPAAIAPAIGHGGQSRIHLTALVVHNGGKAQAQSPSASPSPSVNPGSPMATGKASSSPQAGASNSPSPDQTPQPSPNKSATTSPASASASPTPTPSTSPTPTPTPKPKGELCVTVQSLKGSVVRPGTHARFAIFVWVTRGTAKDAKIQLAVKPHRFSATFTVCPVRDKASCTVSLSTSHTELQARIVVPKKAKNTKLQLTATGSSKDTKNSTASGSNTVKVRHEPKSSPTPTPTPTAPGVGGGGTLPPGGLPPGGLPPGTIPSASFPGLPTPTGIPGSAFPTVGPSPRPSPTTLPQARSIAARDVSAGFPLNVRLIGGQLVGLAILAAAVTIAVARLSLRKQRPRPPEESHSA
jgi:hypothetical protein